MSWIDNIDVEALEEEEEQYDPSNEEYQLPVDYVSTSQIKKWISCGKQYEYRYIKGIDGEQSAMLSRGRLLHEVYEELNRYKMNNNGEIPPESMAFETLDDLFDEYVEEIEEWGDKIPDADNLYTSAEKLTELYYEEILPHTRPKLLEERVHTTINGRIPFVGYIDMVEAPPDTPPDEVERLDSFDEVGPGDIVRDTKITSRKKPESDVQDSIQLTLYAYIAGTRHVGIDNVVETKAKNRSTYRIEDKRDEREIQHALSVVESCVQAISNGEFPKTLPSDWACSSDWCPYYDQCRGKSGSDEPTTGLEELEL